LDLRQSLVLGVIQGLTEFIPVSSTAHLILAPQVLPIHPLRPAIAHTWDTFIQLGTVIPVLLYFWRDWIKLLQGGLRVLAKRRVGPDPDERMVLYLIMGSIPAGVVGVLVEKHVEKFADPGNRVAFLFIGIALIVVGVILYAAERTGLHERNMEDMKASDAWLIGIAQAMALFPGVSRSGATMTAGLFAGFTRETAARFSFMLMMPIMLAATGYKALKILKGAEPMAAGEWQGMLVATVVAGITGYVAIAFLLAWLRTRSLGVFAIWRIIVGGFSICLYFFQEPSVHRAMARLLTGA
jgi:undecaprenyl-diphosphatase